MKYFLLALLLGLLSCQKESLSLQWSIIDLPTSARLEKIRLQQDSVFHIVGGTAYSQGVHLYKDVNSETPWGIDSIASALVYDLTISEEQRTLYAVGISKLRKKNFNDLTWQDRTINELWTSGFIPKSIEIIDPGLLVIGGGTAFRIGFVLRLDESDNSVVVHEFENEISTLIQLPDGKLLAIGYGVAYVSSDKAISWQQLPIYDDFFKDVHFPSSEIGFICGYQGSILKTLNGGSDWSLIRNPKRLSDKRLPFRALYFKNEKEGIAVGDEGLCKWTNDQGQSWSSINDLPQIDYYDVLIHQEFAYLVGEQGTLVKLSLPK